MLLDGSDECSSVCAGKKVVLKDYFFPIPHPPFYVNPFNKEGCCKGVRDFQSHNSNNDK